MFDLELSKLQSLLFAHKEIQQIIDENNISIIQSFGFRSDIISSKLKNVYKITTVRNTLLFNWKMVWGTLLGSIFGNINLYFIKKFDSVIACSVSVHNYLKTINLNSVVIINSIDKENISVKPDSKTINEKRKFLNLPVDEAINITISSKLKGKNIEFLINAFQERELSKKYLVIAGFVEPELLQKYQKLQNTIFIGKVNNLKDYLHVADYFISASLHEGMPNAVLEAMAVGTPVLLSDIPSHIEIFNTTNCEIGKIFKNNDCDDFYKSYEKLINTDYNKLSLNCIETIKNHFNAKEMAFQYEKFYLSKTIRSA
ncbi:MAG: glycosyltransferase family 4 protein [Kiritimatiellia bacterium]